MNQSLILLEERSLLQPGSHKNVNMDGQYELNKGNTNCNSRLGNNKNVNKFHPRKSYGLSKLFDEYDMYDRKINKK